MRFFVGIGCLILGAVLGCAPRRSMLIPDDNLAWSDHLEKARASLDHGEREVARQHFQIAADRNSDCLPAWVALGTLAYEDGNYKAAEVYYQKALKLSPNNVVAINNLARIYLAEGRELDGIDLRVEDALENAGPMAPYLWHTLARIALREGRLADARFALDHAYEKAPEDPVFMKHLEESRQKLAALYP